MSLLDAKAAAAVLGVPSSWVLAEARADRIPHLRLGRYVRFDEREIVAWLQSECHRGPVIGDQAAGQTTNTRRAA